MHNKLRGRIIEKYGSIGNFAIKLEMSRVALSRKINKKSEFTTSEIKSICDLLFIKEEEIGKYFFD